MPWNEIYQTLIAWWESHAKIGTPPPVPLILNGWAYTNDAEKAKRWNNTIKWADTAECSHLIRPLKPEEKYEVDEITTYQIGPLGGPMYLNWDFTRKARPTDEAENKALTILLSGWTNIVGKQIAPLTKPLQFTGKKKRRLLVAALKSASPPWGGWDYLAPNDSRRSFTQLRQDINDAIKPIMIDHIDFCLVDEL